MEASARALVGRVLTRRAGPRRAPCGCRVRVSRARAAALPVRTAASIALSDMGERTGEAAPPAMSAAPPVIIAGGGIGGMALGVACHLAGVPAVVLEQAREIHKAVGNGIGLWGPAQQALRAIGVEEVLMGKGRFMECARYEGSAGQSLVAPTPRVATTGDAAPESASQRLRSCLCIRRGDLQEALMRALPPAMLRVGSCVRSIESVAGSGVGAGAGGDAVGSPGVRVTLDSGEVVDGAVVIGADGINSVVRRLLFHGTEVASAGADLEPASTAPFDSGYDYWRAVATLPDSVSISPFEGWAPNKRFAVVPMAGRELFWFGVVDASERSKLPPSLAGDELLPGRTRQLDDPRSVQLAARDALAELFGGAFSDPAVRKIISGTPLGAIEKTPIRDMPRLSSFIGDVGGAPVALLGDACHAMAPNLAQGACLAIEDALELASQLRVALRAGSPNGESAMVWHRAALREALSRYDKRRVPRAHLVQRLVPMVHQVGRVGGPLERARNTLFAAFPVFVKSPVFDLTHRVALGWQYTAPNLGQGLYARVLGASAFKRLVRESPELQTFHSGEADKRVAGRVFVERGPSKLADTVATLLGLPPAIPRGKVEVHVTVSDRGEENWHRRFVSEDGSSTAVFATQQWVEGEHMVEAMGPLQFVFHLVERSGDAGGGRLCGFDHVLVATRLFGVLPLPRFLSPRICGETRSSGKDGEAWAFGVQVHAPEWAASLIGGKGRDAGMLLRYGGTITDVVRLQPR